MEGCMEPLVRGESLTEASDTEAVPCNKFQQKSLEHPWGACLVIPKRDELSREATTGKGP